MFKHERQSKILEILNEEKKVKSKVLSERLNVSEDTIRRDLKELDEQKLIKRVHSGALCIGPPITSFKYRTEVHHTQKQSLAKCAVTLLHEDSVILIDGSTTNQQVAKAIPLDFKATVITNSPPIACALENHLNIEVIQLGGTLYKNSMISLGCDTIDAIHNLRFDTYLMGIYNINLEEGISVPTLEEANLKRKMLANSTEVIGIVTNDKLETVSNYIISPATSLSYLITEQGNENLTREYQKIGINVITESIKD